MEETYKQIQITYNEDQNTWTAYVYGRRIIKESLKQIKKAIDYQKKKAFKRISVWVIPQGWGSGRYRKAEVTSLTDDEYGGNIWVSFGGKSRERVGQRDLRADTPKNKELIERIHTLMDSLDELEKQQNGLYEQLEEVTDLFKTEDEDEQNTDMR